MTTGLSPTLKVTTVWLLLGLSVFLGVQWWQHAQDETRFRVTGEEIELRRQADGHYHWPGTVNGRAVDFLVDTGATGTAIPAVLARELGLEPIGQVQSSTAGGMAVGDLVRADVELRGGVRAERLGIVALPGLVGTPLLGMDILGRLSLRQHAGTMHIDLRPSAASADISKTAALPRQATTSGHR